MNREGWTTRRLGELFINSKTRGKPGLPTLSVTMNDGLVSRDTLERKMETNLDPSQHLLVRRGDLAYNMMRMWQGASGLAAFDGLVSPAYVVLRAGPDIDPQFAAYLFKHPRMIYLFWAYSHGMTEDRLRLYFDDFALIPIDLPPIEEQRRIVEILSTWDRAAATVKELISISRMEKAELTRALLTGRHRLVGFVDDWRPATLASLGRFRKGKGISRSDAQSTGLPCVRYGEIYTLHHDVIRKFGSFITTASAAESEPISGGDLLFAASGETAEEIGKCVAFLGDDGAYAGGDIVVFRPEYENPIFLAYLLNSPELAMQKARLGQGHSVVHISASNLGKLKFSLPGRAEQDAIAEQLFDADTRTLALVSQLDSITREAAALSQRLLVGKDRAGSSAEAAWCP